MYESLLELLRLLGDARFRVEIICPAHDFAEDPTWTHPAVTYRFLKPTRRSPSIPMTVRLLLTALRSAIKHRPSFMMGADSPGSILAATAAAATRTPLLYYGLELPHLRQHPIPWLTRLEHWSIRRAALIVTMDQAHSDFIQSQTGANEKRIALLPNAASGVARITKSTHLRDKYSGLTGKTIILHAGGIGQAQQSLDLAKAAADWDPGHHLVFQAHCRMDRESYFQEFAKEIKTMANVTLNNEPAPPDALDSLITSADIGIAWYDRAFLGYRADLLGLAPGKIGRYLRNGIPVIVTNLPTVSEYINRYRCGICIDSLDQAGAAIDAIMKDYEMYSRNAIRCFNEVWRPEPHLENLKVRIHALSRV